MALLQKTPLFKSAPAIKLLLPLIAGILIQWYMHLPHWVSIVIFFIAIACSFCFNFILAQIKFKMQHWQGIFLSIAMLAIGMYCTWHNDVQMYTTWYGNHIHDSDVILATINEPPIEKNKSIKADATVQAIVQQQQIQNHSGKLLLYFSKDSLSTTLQYGDVILIHKKLQKIKNAGNPGGFNYERYAGFQQTFYNCFLKSTDWVLLPQKNKNVFWQFIFTAKINILNRLQKYIGNNRDRLGIAEALLIGYTNDLDKDLVQAYTNTGVVHIIAISGMHLGLIYVLLVWIFGKIPFIKKMKGVQVVLVLACLWLFSILTGGSASVCRSAVMFTCIAIGNAFFSKSSMYNSLAASAFLMLCYNPYYLWDVGFQLSYLAVIGIVTLQMPIYNWLYIKHKWLDAVWKLIAISLAAQIFTFPICIYYFHQFPNLFLITNIIAVPLSSAILYGILILLVCSGLPYAGNILGQCINWALWLMNKIIQGFSNLPFTVWDNIPATFATTIFLYITVCFACLWLLHNNKKFLYVTALALLVFVSIHTVNNWQVKNQQKLIVYNVPQKQAIDFVVGNQYQFKGDSVLLEDGMLQNFHLKPGRIALQLNKRVLTNNLVQAHYPFYQFGSKKILLLDSTITFEPTFDKVAIDVVVVCNNAPFNAQQLIQTFNCKQIVFDASNSVWKIDKWQTACSEVHLQSYSIPKQGAFVWDIQ